MKVIVISNCLTGSYHGAVTALFPDWDVKAAGFNQAQQWLETGEKPEFAQFLAECDLYIGFPVEGLHMETALNPNAERLIIPDLYFRGLHPDVAKLDGFWGPFSTEEAPHTQCSLIMVGGRALGKTAEETQALFREDVYERLGYFDLFASERNRMIADFAKNGIALDEAFNFWETQRDFVFVPHHPRSVVPVEIIRCAFKDRYLDPEAYVASQSLRETEPDRLAPMTEIWPVYPEIARRFGFEGSLTWHRFPRYSPREMSLAQVIDKTFASLDKMDESWKSVPFVAECAKLLEDV